MVNGNNVIQLTELTDEALVEICRAAQVIACECPAYIARLLRQVRVFKEYTTTCADQFPADAATHQWLSSQASVVETILFQTMIELMQKEGLIDASLCVSLDKLSTRAREIVLQQVGAM
ncbi:MAG: hypothetical protein IGS48_10680 [Oscillatoriales cyanobacterium C42_A2020_001]|nr:hypothetical protein [Leptolyngbyaceae cyanobacterium C42_A2020_001]